MVVMAIMTTGCGAGGTEEPAVPRPAGGEAAAPLSVYVVNYPLMYFAQRIGGAHVAVVFPAPGDGDPAFWQPGVEAITAYQNADLIVRNGATYAKWMELVTLPQSKMVDTSSAFGDRLIEIDSAVTHSHGPEGEHSHGEIAFTTWLDPQLAMLQAEAVAAAISVARPDASSDFEANLAALRADLEALDQRLEAATRGLGDTPLLGSHPVYQYLARRYGLNLRSVHFEPDENPDEEAWTELERLHGAHPAATMLWEAQPLPEIAARLGALGIESMVFDPAGNRPASGDFLEVMAANADGLEGRLAR
jgi:zinc transport system substrate-binding protein